jgi:hypothetical protein
MAHAHLSLETLKIDCEKEVEKIVAALRMHSFCFVEEAML